jgi:hypothetical protein
LNLHSTGLIAAMQDVARSYNVSLKLSCAVALHLIRDAFIDLAGAFARIDAVAAEAAAGVSQ